MNYFQSMQVSFDTNKENLLTYIPCVSRLKKEMICGNRILHVFFVFPSLVCLSYFTFLAVFLRKKQEKRGFFCLKWLDSLTSLHKSYIRLQIFFVNDNFRLVNMEDRDDNKAQSCRKCSHSRSLLYKWENHVFVYPIIFSLDHCGLQQMLSGHLVQEKRRNS